MSVCIMTEPFQRIFAIQQSNYYIAIIGSYLLSHDQLISIFDTSIDH